MGYPNKRLGFLGPEGTFTEEALLSQKDLLGFELIPFITIDSVLDALNSGAIDLGFVPIENSIEGTVSATIDSLVFDYDLTIVREVILDIHLQLLGLRGATLSDIKEIWSYPHALGQCRKFTANNLPNAVTNASTSTAEAAKMVALKNDGAIGAIAPRVSGKIYDLSVIAENIEDHKGNQTRFFLVQKDGIPPSTGHDKTALVCFQLSDTPGSLFSILAEFYARTVNLIKLESRPSKEGLGDYCFVIELEGHVSDPIVTDALMSLKRKLPEIKFLGSFPNMTDPKGLPLESDASDPSRIWINKIIDRIQGSF
ncbi:prephenate dehydratase [Acidithrix ferrooxidans]|uniref:Prephenate dehydratase n=1 Tax=Acidithrix ferrooxidans TaxID=1280514 RepID=A0A0D8HMX8_9ACTN|nr:prephenate dehydratase [Acidithrix ferrooxidans]KJF18431.1 prephenate dehydratase [Acidithrix ferrooxidans]